jgi:hypothetical protein
MISKFEVNRRGVYIYLYVSNSMHSAVQRDNTGQSLSNVLKRLITRSL